MSSVLIFAIPLSLIVFFYYHILNKLREALKGREFGSGLLVFEVVVSVEAS